MENENWFYVYSGKKYFMLETAIGRASYNAFLNNKTQSIMAFDVKHLNVKVDDLCLEDAYHVEKLFYVKVTAVDW